MSRILAARRGKAATPQAGEVFDTNTGYAELILGILPLTAMDQRLAVAGISGSGKTYATKGLVERLLDGGTRFCIVDSWGCDRAWAPNRTALPQANTL